MSEDKCWLQTNWKKLLKKSVTGFTLVLILTYIATGYSIIILNEEALKSLIQAEATILGFFGIVVVYILKSLDDKQDRWHKVWFDLTEEGKHTEVDVDVAALMGTSGGEAMTKGEICNRVMTRISEHRGKIIGSSSAIGIFLVASMLLSIFVLGVSNVVVEVGVGSNLPSSIVSILGGIAIYTFFLSVVELFKMFRDMAKFNIFEI